MQPTPLVLVPGLLCTDALFAYQIATLGGDRAVTIADHRSDDSLGGIALRLLGNAPERFSLAGLSMGGYVAMEVMRRAPERVARLMLIDTSARSDTAEQTDTRDRFLSYARRGWFDRIVPILYPSLVHTAHLGDRALRDIVERMATDTGAEAFIRQQRAVIARPDARGDLRRIACPTTIVVGDGDTLTPPELAREMASLIPSAHLEIIAGAGHLPTLEAPGIVTRLMHDWLSRDG